MKIGFHKVLSVFDSQSVSESVRNKIRAQFFWEKFWKKKIIWAWISQWYCNEEQNKEFLSLKTWVATKIIPKTCLFLNFDNQIKGYVHLESKITDDT
jgi:hypothetical protein